MAVSYNSDYEYANAKLGGSIVRHNGLPVVVKSVDIGNGRTILKHLLTGASEIVDLKDLDLEPIELGYCNWPFAIYLARLPVRNWRQGLRQDFIYSAHPIENIYSNQFYNMVQGIYPTIMNCVNSIYCEEAFKKAFSKVFALGKTNTTGILDFFYKDYKVGELDINRPLIPKLYPDYKYLTEMVEETIHDHYI